MTVYSMDSIFSTSSSGDSKNPNNAAAAHKRQTGRFLSVPVPDICVDVTDEDEENNSKDDDGKPQANGHALPVNDADSRMGEEVESIKIETPKQQKKAGKHLNFEHMSSEEIAVWVDLKARIIFPSLFLIFNVLYWCFAFRVD